MRRWGFGSIEGVSKAVDAKGSTVLHSSLGDSVGKEDEPLAGVQLPFGGFVGGVRRSGSECWMRWSFEYVQLAVCVHQVGGRMSAVHQGQGRGCGAPAG